MKVGDLIRYAAYPHKELHASGKTGIVIDAAVSPPEVQLMSNNIPCVLVLWNCPRGAALPANSLKDLVCWEYTEELEVLNDIAN
jgi:hypothetical protein